MNSILKLMARLTGEAVGEKVDKVGHFVAKAGKNVVKGLGVAVVVAGLAACQQPDSPTTVPVVPGGTIPGGDGGGGDPWSYTPNSDYAIDSHKVIFGDIANILAQPIEHRNTAAGKELFKIRAALQSQESYFSTLLYNNNNSPSPLSNRLFTLQGNANSGLNKAYHTNDDFTLLSTQANTAVSSFKVSIGSTHASAVPYIDKFMTLCKIHQQKYRALLPNESNLLNSLGITQDQKNKIKDEIDVVRNNISDHINGGGGMTQDEFDIFIQQIEDIARALGYREDLGAKNLEQIIPATLQSQAAAKNDTQITLPEMQAQPKLSRAEIQAQHGIVNSEELATHGGSHRKTLVYHCA